MVLICNLDDFLVNGRRGVVTELHEESVTELFVGSSQPTHLPRTAPTKAKIHNEHQNEIDLCGEENPFRRETYKLH